MLLLLAMMLLLRGNNVSIFGFNCGVFWLLLHLWPPFPWQGRRFRSPLGARNPSDIQIENNALCTPRGKPLLLKIQQHSDAICCQNKLPLHPSNLIRNFLSFQHCCCCFFFAERINAQQRGALSHRLSVSLNNVRIYNVWKILWTFTYNKHQYYVSFSKGESHSGTVISSHLHFAPAPL